MLCKMASGGMAKIRVDMLSDRPHAMHSHLLQGTEASYESAREAGERHRIWLRSRSADANTWLDLETLEEEFLPEWYRQREALASSTGHGGGDFYVIAEFVEAIREGRPFMMDIHAAMDMTLPGLVSQLSIQERGRWLPVPDSRTW